MNITSVKTGNFANGFSYFCPNCGDFFSVQFYEKTNIFAQLADKTEYCPSCGCDELISSTEELIDYLSEHDTDTVNFYHAFPPDEPLPNSRIWATPKQVEWIIGCVLSDKENKLPVTIESLAAQLGYSKDVVTKVFEELHIPETGGAE